MPTVNLSPYTAESEAIARRLRLAEALGQKAAQPLEMPTQAGVKISPLAGLAKMLDEYTAGRQEKLAREEAKALGERFQTQSRNESSQFLEAMQGKPFVPEGPSTFTANVDQRDVAENPRMVMQPERNEMNEIIQPGEAGAGNFGVTPGTPAQEAVAPDMRKALAIALSAQANPAIQSAGGAMLANMYKPAETAFAKINPSQYTPDSVRAFAAGGGKDYSLLVEQPNLSFQNTGTTIQPFSPRTGLPVGASTPIGVSPNTKATLDQNRALSDRAFNELTLKDRLQLENDARRLNISAQELFFNTGILAGGGARLPPPVTPSAATPTGAPAVPAAMPAPSAQPVVAQPAPAMPVAARPAAVAPAPSAVSGLTPKAQQALMLEDAQAKAKKERGMSGIGSVIDEARKIMKGEAVDKDGKPIKAPLPTQSYAGAAGDFISGIFGGSSEGAAQAEQLKVLGGALVMSMPRMEGPQSDRDVQAYREMAGQVGDNTLPIARRLKALDMVEKLYRKYDTSDVPPPNAVRRIR